MEKKIQAYLYEHIPIARAMGIQVEQAARDKVVLRASFLPNINHKKTVFGGSLHAVATLACWSLLYINLEEESPVQIVITKSDAAYLAPVDDDFRAVCIVPDGVVWERFLKTLHMRGKGRIHLAAQIAQQGKLCVDYHGVFAAISG